MIRRFLAARVAVLTGAVFVGLFLVVSSVTWDRISAARDARQWSEHSYDVLDALKDLAITVRDAERGQRGYLLTGREDYLSPYDDAVARVGLLQGTLQRLTTDNPTQQSNLQRLAPVLQHKLEELAQTVELRRTVGPEAALKLVETDVGRNFMREIEALLSQMTADERGLLKQRLAETAARSLWVQGLMLGGTLLAVIALTGAAYLLNRSWTRSRIAELDQRELAVRLRTSLDSLSQGVGVFTSDRHLVHWNECFQVLLGLPKAMVRVGTPYAAFVEHTSESGEPFFETEEQLNHGPVAPVDYPRKRGDGQELEVRRSPMPDGGFVLTVTDMTRRAQAEAVLREAQKMQAIGQLTGGIAHDFNNLLTVILGNLEFIRSKIPADVTVQTRLERAAWAAQRGATLTAQLLAFARKQALDPTAIDLGATMPDFIPLLQRTLGENIEVRYVENAGLWPAMADPAQLESALLNLALNARDAMSGGGRLTIELANKNLDHEYARRHVEVTPGDYTMLAVSDTGHGMSPETLARVFEPFFTTKPDGKGTGLGLAMVFGFVKQSGGHIKIYSEPDEGTSVRIYLPRAVRATLTSGRRSGAPIDLPRGTASILVVEDEAGVREIAVAILRDLGYRVFEAADGEQGLHVFGTVAMNVDLLLTDVVLPGSVRGRELAERITAIRPSIRVLFMSGYTENSIVHQGRLDEGVHLIGKPFRREELARRVAEVLAPITSERASSDSESKIIDMRSRTQNGS